MLVVQSCLSFCDPMDCSLPGSSVHGFFQARILKWTAISFTRGSSWPRNWTWVSCIAGRFSNIWATEEAHFICLVVSSVQFSHSVVSDFLRPHESQHARPPCPSPPLGVYSNPCPLSWWCHPTISSSVVPFSSCLQSFAHQGLFKWVSSSHQVAKVLEFQLQH